MRVMRASYLHVHSMRLATGEEVLIARVVAPDGRVGYGFSFRLDATEARHMAEWAAGVRAVRPAYESQLDHAWERAHRHYTATFAGKGYSDIQEQAPRAIEELEHAHLSHR